MFLKTKKLYNSKISYSVGNLLSYISAKFYHT